VCIRALPADSLECLEETAFGNTALPVAAGAGIGAGAGLAVVVLVAFVAAGAGGAAGLAVVVGWAAAGAGAAVASARHCALRKSFHFMPLSVPASLAALYLALHSCMESACAVPCNAMAARSVAVPKHGWLTCLLA
jgi:hypothetical protein